MKRKPSNLITVDRKAFAKALSLGSQMSTVLLIMDQNPRDIDFTTLASLAREWQVAVEKFSEPTKETA